MILPHLCGRRWVLHGASGRLIVREAKKLRQLFQAKRRPALELHAERQATRCEDFLDFIERLAAEIGPRYAQRNGGYLRILKMGFRIGDNAPMALVELLDQPERVEEPAPTAAE